jgi:hypothetical protein
MQYPLCPVHHYNLPLKPASSQHHCNLHALTLKPASSLPGAVP